MSDWDDKTMRVPAPNHKVDPERDASSLGNLLRLHNPTLTPEHVQQALEHQREHPGIKLGEALVALGFIAEDQVKEAFQNQLLLRCAKPSKKRSQLILAQVDMAEQQVGKLDSMVDGLTDMVTDMLGKLKKK